jgi:hypothetical protein
MVFPVQSATEATIGHLEIIIIAKNKETSAGQVKRQDNASTVFRLVWQSSYGTHTGSTATRKSFPVYAIQFVLSFLNVREI